MSILTFLPGRESSSVITGAGGYVVLSRTHTSLHYRLTLEISSRYASAPILLQSGVPDPITRHLAEALNQQRNRRMSEIRGAVHRARFLYELSRHQKPYCDLHFLGISLRT